MRRLLVAAPFGAAAAALVLAPLAGFRLNASESMPRGLWREAPLSRPLERGDIVVACPPEAHAALAAERGYLPLGDCPGGSAPVLKSVGAVPGDTVVAWFGAVAVAPHGEDLPARDADREGRPLAQVPPGAYRVAPGEVWLLSEKANSWDSRYWGPVPLSSIRGVAEPVLVVD